MSEKCCINVFDDGPLGVEELESLTNSNGDELEIKKRIALWKVEEQSEHLLTVHMKFQTT